MQKKEIKLEFEEFENETELTPEDQNLLINALESAGRSYAPYSEFHVGAAVLLENGEVVCGSNQENAAYPSGLCAERVALFYANSQYPGVAVKAMAITAKADNFLMARPITPCGSCRQVIAETENRQQSKIKLIMHGETGPVHVMNGIENLLPFTFYEKQLQKTKK